MITDCRKRIYVNFKNGVHSQEGNQNQLTANGRPIRDLKNTVFKKNPLFPGIIKKRSFNLQSSSEHQ